MRCSYYKCKLASYIVKVRVSCHLSYSTIVLAKMCDWLASSSVLVVRYSIAIPFEDCMYVRTHYRRLSAYIARMKTWKGTANAAASSSYGGILFCFAKRAGFVVIFSYSCTDLRETMGKSLMYLKCLISSVYVDIWRLTLFGMLMHMWLL